MITQFIRDLADADRTRKRSILIAHDVAA
ncbi:MAG: hypothetical protein QOC65_1137, partial [Sphingomonadales bacterium]|nr:hypothetical protein [Sphingomonadales bacterium]